MIDDMAIWDITLSACVVDFLYNSQMNMAEIADIDVCPPDYIGLAGGHATNSIYETDGPIESTQVLSSPADIIYDSASYIELNQGFEVGAGSIFHALIDGCD